MYISHPHGVHMSALERYFYRFLGSRMLVSITINAFQVFYLWRIVEQYHSVFLAGMVSTIYLVVSIISSIPIGHLIDRLNSTHISLASSLIALTGVILLLSGTSLPLIYTASGFLALGTTMKGDSFSATIKKHLSEEDFLKGNSMTMAANYTSVLSGTIIGGLAIVYYSNFLTLILFSFALVSVITSIPIKEVSTREPGSSAKKELASAIGFYRKILGFVAVAFILNGMFEALDVYSSGLFHLVLNASPLYYTAFIAAISVGGIGGALVVSRMKGKVDNPFVISLMVVCYAPFFLLLGLSRIPVLDVGVGVLIGVFMSLINVPLSTVIMKVIPREIYGKVSAFLRVFLNGSTPAMAAVLSFVAIFLQVDTILLYIGIIMLPVAAMSFVVLPKIFKMESEKNHAQETLELTRRTGINGP